MRKFVPVFSAVAAIGLASPTLAADLPIYEVVADDVVVGEIISSWDGFFIGVNAGFEREKNRGDFIGDLRPSFDDGGVIAGVQAGYNYQIGHWVLGVEADLMYAPLEASVTAPSGNFTTESKWLSTIRGRIGITSNGYLFYVTGGAAFAELKSNYLGATNSNNAVGWTAGAGLEMAIGNNFTARGEYLYTDFGNDDYLYGTQTAGYNTEMHIFRAGLNYYFR